jgi:hypothetical protein
VNRIVVDEDEARKPTGEVAEEQVADLRDEALVP